MRDLESVTALWLSTLTDTNSYIVSVISSTHLGKLDVGDVEAAFYLRLCGRDLLFHSHS